MKRYGINNKGHRGRGSFPESNQGEFYSGTGHNGMWEYHVWTANPFEARSFASMHAAQKYKTEHTIPGRVVRID